MDKYGGNPLPDEVLDAIRETGVALKGPITTPIGGGFRSVNVRLRNELDLYAQAQAAAVHAYAPYSRFAVGAALSTAAAVLVTAFVTRQILRPIAAVGAAGLE